jgi:prephenate dehydratase
MSTIATLGPAQTFSERAAQAYCEKHPEYAGIRLYPTIRKVMAAIGTECQRGILPIERMVMCSWYWTCCCTVSCA